MFFLLSKLLVWLLRPLIWLLGGLIWALFTRRPDRRRRLLWYCLAGFFLFSNPWLFNRFVGWWEVETPDLRDLTEPYDIGILLGGFSSFDDLVDDGRYNFNERANRFLNALELYHRGKIDKLLISGGSGSLLYTHASEAATTRDWLLLAGIPNSDILIEDRSRNTWENARFTSDLLQRQYPQARCLLITSAWHMRRARGCFRRTGLEVTPFSVDYLHQRDRPDPEWWLLPKAKTLAQWDLLIKEWVGYGVYWLAGYLGQSV